MSDRATHPEPPWGSALLGQLGVGLRRGLAALPLAASRLRAGAAQAERFAAALRYDESFCSMAGSESPVPLLVPGRAPSVLCLHGFGGAPQEVALVLREAASLGLSARAPLLVGHGQSPRELSRLRYEDILKDAERHFRELRAQGPVVLAGLSMGSLLALDLSLRAPGAVPGLVLLSNALTLASPFPARALDLVRALQLPDFAVPKAGSDLGDPEELARHPSYRLQPVHAALSVQEAGTRLCQELFRVHCPALVLHGARDRVCPVSNAWLAGEALGTSDVRVRVFPRSHHILTRDVERQAVAEEVRAFLARVTAES